MAVIAQTNIWKLLADWTVNIARAALQWVKDQLKTDSVLVAVIVEIMAHIHAKAEEKRAKTTPAGVDSSEPIIIVKKGDKTRVYARQNGNKKRTRIK